jgi:hypothetical protein
MQPHVIADIFEQLAQLHGLAHVPYLGGRADRDVQQQMRGTGRQFLGQDGRHHLALRIDAQRPFN